MNCVQCNAKLSFDEEYHYRVVKGCPVYPELCFKCLYGESPGEDDSIDDEWWGNVWPDQE